jgi:hypothetical protein
MREMRYVASTRLCKDGGCNEALKVHRWDDAAYTVREIDRNGQVVGLPKLIFQVAAPDTKLETSSQFMAHSFLKYRWKETLLWFISQCTPEPFEEAGDDGFPTKQEFENQVPVVNFLHFVDRTSAIPVGSSPHAIFAFSSLPNFLAAIEDFMDANWVADGGAHVSCLSYYECL